ncbi:MAG TPA: glycosyltransferase family 4 protein [Polyangiaceae bacterium]|jgi:glycosyltransferase involved in cell wall biosynthesis|nr:glycosyltransferase family 4 protein [Polyangiaceae bacterium]
MSVRPIAYVMEQTLGSITHYLNLRRQEPMPESGARTWIPIEYRQGRVPWTLTGSILARRALGSVLEDVDGIFVHTTTLSLLSPDYYAKKPTVISSDGTPLNKRTMREGYGLRPEGRIAESAKRLLFRSLFSLARGFVAWSSWTKDSFVEDYGCKEDDVVVIPPGIDLNQFKPGDRDHELPRILFVGGDFARKGGDLLLKVFRDRLRGKAELDIVTRTDLPEEPGIRVHHNIQANSDKLLGLYGSSDIFVVPTRADCYPLVCMEALAAGLPLVATRVGGIRDMVREGETGHLIDVDDAHVLGDVLVTLVDDPNLRHKMSVACREDARNRFEVRTNAKRLFDFVRARC